MQSIIAEAPALDPFGLPRDYAYEAWLEENEPDIDADYEDWCDDQERDLVEASDRGDKCYGDDGFVGPPSYAEIYIPPAPF